MENAAVLFLSKDLSLEKGCDFKIFFSKIIISQITF